LWFTGKLFVARYELWGARELFIFRIQATNLIEVPVSTSSTMGVKRLLYKSNLNEFTNMKTPVLMVELSTTIGCNSTTLCYIVIDIALVKIKKGELC